ncbi:MAG: Eco57I restriction-modification methylase domain-containing protein, partial [Lactobacillus sp.]|nr:Eco57I restriction-modification methylase domain-containing protein [Lactobacillus sp.]
VIGNPPYAKVSDRQLLKAYKKNSSISKTTNLFALFLEKAYTDGDWVSLIVPKSVLNAPEYNEIRTLLTQAHIHSILDFGENGFKGVKIETVNLLFTTTQNPTTTHIVSLTQKIDIIQKQSYFTDNSYPTWLLYRNAFFDEFANTMELGVFEVFRDRQIVNSMLLPNGKYRVLKSRNIGSNEIIDISGYDSYITNIDQLIVLKFLNQENVVLVPNLSYAPRACFLPANTIANGSVAMLTLKRNIRPITEQDLRLYATKEFTLYYRIARNYGTCSLNIDNNSVYFFGIRR